MKDILYAELDPKGRTFNIVGDLESISRDIQPLLNVDPDDEEYGINNVPRTYSHEDDRYTAKERAEDEEAFKAILEYKHWDWKDIFDKIPRKKNGTYAKGRVVIVHRGETFSHYWEDSYGWNAPEVRVKTLDDFTAELEFTYRVEKY
ncbi:hypothetical protein COJ01_17350 [Priestia megaterium]|uniref:hypothetical protein n=1 Tax=Priestia megaterium TaxID=1404 RepID=UPI000BFA5130|nr:hypothetical protein [Priestia megaterium]PFK99836.1 hypothetical protein COJ01_17350 [Priestia megaterium]